MNKDQIKGGTKSVVGKVQEKVGRAVGSTEHEAKGIAKQISGDTQKGIGDVKEIGKDAARDVDLRR